MDRKLFFTHGLKILKGQMIEQTLPEKIHEKVTNIPFRPLGISTEKDFIVKCNSCEKCIPACPTESILSVEEFDGIKRPQLVEGANCISCENMECISACEANALSEKGQNYIAKINFNEEYCLAYNGSICQVCYDQCPEKNKAIFIEKFKPVFDEKFCTACKKCSEFCVAGAETILIEPLAKFTEKM